MLYAARASRGAKPSWLTGARIPHRKPMTSMVPAARAATAMNGSFSTSATRTTRPHAAPSRGSDAIAMRRSG